MAPQIPTLNFSAIQAKPNAQLTKTIWLVFGVGILLLFVPGIIILINIRLIILAIAFVPIAITVVFVGIGIIFYIYSTSNSQLNKQLGQFAQQNGMQFIPRQSPQKRPGILFSLGSMQKESAILSGTFLGLDFSTFQFWFSAGGSKSNRDDSYQVAELTLQQTMPHLIIQTQPQNGGRIGPVVPVVLSDSQRIKLEGNFDQYFAVYNLEKHQIDTLTLLTPDVMQLLIEKARGYDIEIVENKLYLYHHGILSSAGQFESLFSLLSIFLTKTHRELNFAAPTAQPAIAPQQTATTPSSVRLRQSWWVKFGSVAIICSLALLYVLRLTLGNNPVINYGMSTLLALVPILVLIRFKKR